MNKELIAEIADELRDLQAVCERLGVDDDGVLHEAADRIEELEKQLEAVRKENDEWRGKVKRLNQIIADDSEQLEAVQTKLTNTEWHLANEANLHAVAEKQLEAVRGLPDKWRKSNYYNHHVMPEYVCANELEAALKESE